MATVKQWITNLYDETTLPPTKVYRKVPGKENTPAIEFTKAPRTTFLGTSSYEWLLPNLSRVDASGGFLARWMIVFAPDIKKRIAFPKESDKALLVPLARRLKRISEMEGSADLSQVVEMYEQWYHQTADRFGDQKNRALAEAFCNRHRDHVLKLAVVFEMSQSGSLQATPRAMKRAIHYAAQMEEGLFKLLETGLDAEGYAVTEMTNCIRQAGNEGLHLSDLTKSYKNVDASLRHKRIQTMTQTGDVRRFTRSTPGRVATILVHREYETEYRKNYPDDKAVA
jgi:hypothetical protein